MATKLLLTRHGHVEGISPPRFRGRTDLPLTPLGTAQARQLAQAIARFWRPSAIYCSPLTRCVQTAGRIGLSCELRPQSLDALVDVDYGDCRDQTYDRVKADRPELFALWRTAPQFVRFPDGESLQDVAARGMETLRRLARKHEGETIVVVAHDSVNRVILTSLLNMPLSQFWVLRQDPCCIDEIDLAVPDVRVSSVNRIDHLDRSDIEP